MFLKRTNPFARVGLRYRLAGAYTLVVGATLIVFSILLFREFLKTHQKEFDDALYNHAIDVSEAVNVDLFGDLSLEDAVSTGEKLFPFSVGQSFLEIRASEGELIGRSESLGDQELPFDLEKIKTLKRKSAFFQTVDLQDYPEVNQRESTYRMITYVIQEGQSEDFYLQIAVPRYFIERERQALLTFFMLTIPAVLVIALLTGLLLSHRALRPIREITALARAIGAQNLCERVPVPEAQDELQELALTFNGLLERLKKAFDGQERFVADASHQLKTPLSILRGELDVLLSRERSSKDLMVFLGSASQEINQLIRMTDDLLILARVDAGRESLHKSEVHLEDILLESVTRLEKLAHHKHIKLNVQLDGEMALKGDPELLACMISNLIENAIKYSPSGSTVEMATSETACAYQIEIRDEGPGIDPDRLPHIFERFYRAPNKTRVPGTGLGLAIAQQIAHVHDGRIDVESRPPQGSVFRVEIKKN